MTENTQFTPPPQPPQKPVPPTQEELDHDNYKQNLRNALSFAANLVAVVAQFKDSSEKSTAHNNAKKAFDHVKKLHEDVMKKDEDDARRKWESDVAEYNAKSKEILKEITEFNKQREAEAKADPNAPR